MLLLVTNCGFQGRVVMIKEPVVVIPKFQSFSSHIFYEASQNVTVKVRIDRSVRRKKFAENNPLHVKKTMSVLYVELLISLAFLIMVIVGSSTATIVALFLDHNRKSNFRHLL
jgi:hypothetical protein